MPLGSRFRAKVGAAAMEETVEVDVRKLSGIGRNLSATGIWNYWNRP